MEIKLKDVIISANTGADAIRRAPIVDHDTGIKCLRIGDISNRRKYSDWGYTNVDEDNYKRYKLRKGNIIIARTGSTVGINKYIENDCKAVYNNGLIRLVIDETKYNSRFIYYIIQMKEFRNYINGIAFGTTGQPNIQINDLLNFKFNNIILEKQNKIVNILENIDKKIELNNQINDNLYEISKQLLLKYLHDNSNTEKINISKLLNVFTGKKNANETSPTGKYKFFSCAPESLLSDTYIYDGAAIIVAGNGAYTGRTRFYDGKFELYQRTYGLTLKDDFDKDNIYGLYVFMKTIFEPDKMGGTHGSAIPYIVLSDLTDYKLKYNKTEFDKFSNLVSSNIKMIQENEFENERLIQLRDILLPKLINGEINIEKIEL